MSFTVLSTLDIDPDEGHYWERIDEEVADNLQKLEAFIDGGFSYEQREEIRRDAFLIELDADEIHIALDGARFVNIAGRVE